MPIIGAVRIMDRVQLQFEDDRDSLPFASLDADEARYLLATLVSALQQAGPAQSCGTRIPDVRTGGEGVAVDRRLDGEISLRFRIGASPAIEVRFPDVVARRLKKLLCSVLDEPPGAPILLSQDQPAAGAGSRSGRRKSSRAIFSR